MPAYTCSVSRGAPAPAHNMRVFRNGACPENVDPTLSHRNVVLLDRPLAEVYDEAFGAALAAHNARQREIGRPGRQIDDYLQHVRDSRTLEPVYEFVVQVGNREDRPSDAECVGALTDAWGRITRMMGPHFAQVQAVVHLDEPDGSPHLHMSFVPVADSKRGLAVQNSLTKALAQAGFAASNPDAKKFNARDSAYGAMCLAMMGEVEASMAERGWARAASKEAPHDHRTPEQQREWGREQARLAALRQEADAEQERLDGL